MPTTPIWSAARNGMPGDLGATDHAAQAAQELGTHVVFPVYAGSPLVSPNGTAFSWAAAATGTDYDQPFTLPGGHTSIGRVALPVLATGEGADLLVSLCQDDGSGNPVTGAPIASTIVPAEWITNLSSATGVAGGGEQGTGSPLAAPAFNSTGVTAPVLTNWAAPAVGPNGAAAFAAPVTAGSFTVLLGGYDPTSATAQSHVATVQYLGNQTLSQPTLQPPLPQAVYFAAAAATTSAIVVAGGVTPPTISSNVWVASWDTSTGQVGTWSKQASLPTAVNQNVMAAYGDTVYMIGGINSTTVNPTLYTATVSNGQLSAWVAGPTLPGPALYAQCVAVVGNWLIVAGGQDSPGTIYSNTYYTSINPDGSLNGWRPGPPLPVVTFQSSPQWDVCTTDTAMIIIGGSGTGSAFTRAVQVLETTPSGIGTWQLQDYGVANQWQVLAYPETDTSWTVITINRLATQYNASYAYKMPMLSVPLRVSGLTAGAKYHVLLHQSGGDASDFLQVGILGGALPDGLLQRAAYTAGAWTSDAPSAINMSVYDQTAAGPMLHTWEDPAAGGVTARTSTMVFDNLGRLLGMCESTVLPGDPLNTNPTFTTGTSPWTATNATLTQSNAQTHGGLPFSGLLTPAGGFPAAGAQCELISISGAAAIPTANRWLRASGWVYSPGGYASVSLSIAWYDSSQALISTSSAVVGVPAATWTNLVNDFLAPAGAAYAALAPAESGTPGAGDTLYLSAVTLTYSPGVVRPLSAVTVVDYDAATGEPVGTTVL